MIDLNVVFGFALAYLFAFAAVPIIRVMAYKIDAVDVPRDKRRMHKRPIPRMGGLAIFFGFLLSVLCFSEAIDEKILAILAGSLIIVVTGILDDTYQLKPLVKLAGQILAAAIVIYFDVKIEFLTNPFYFGIGKSTIDLHYLSYPVTLIWIIAITNAVNLIDGLDGLATSISAISALALTFIAITMGNTNIAIMFVAVAGACFGFLPYNHHPAKIFLGDTGALFLGFTLATLSVEGMFKSFGILTYIVPVIILGLPIFDTSFAIIRRLCKGQGIMTADRGHLHHRLIDKGFSHRETVTMLTTASAMLSITAIVLATRGVNRTLALVIALIAFLFGLKYYYTDKNIDKEYIKHLEEISNESEENTNE